MKVAYLILSQPDRRWHWVLRLWRQGPDKLPEVWSAKKSHASAAAAFEEVERFAAEPQGPQPAVTS